MCRPLHMRIHDTLRGPATFPSAVRPGFDGVTAPDGTVTIYPAGATGDDGPKPTPLGNWFKEQCRAAGLARLTGAKPGTEFVQPIGKVGKKPSKK